MVSDIQCTNCHILIKYCLFHYTWLARHNAWSGIVLVNKINTRDVKISLQPHLRDIPELRADHLRQAFGALTENDLVIGPLAILKLPYGDQGLFSK